MISNYIMKMMKLSYTLLFCGDHMLFSVLMAYSLTMLIDANRTNHYSSTRRISMTFQLILKTVYTDLDYMIRQLLRYLLSRGGLTLAYACVKRFHEDDVVLSEDVPEGKVVV